MLATTSENVENVAKLLSDDRRYSCDEIAHELDISHWSIHRILTECLQMRKIAARWVPHMLFKSEKHQCVNIARKLLKRHVEDSDEMLQRIVAIDETWIRSFEPELKCQSREWHTKNSPRLVKDDRNSESARGSRFKSEKHQCVNIARKLRSLEPELKRQSREWHTKNSPRPVKHDRNSESAEEVGSEFVLPYSSITRWVRQFNNGRNTVSNKHLCGRPLLATTSENVESREWHTKNSPRPVKFVEVKTVPK